MRECTFISKLLFLLLLFFNGNAFAQAPNGTGAPAPAVTTPKKDDPGLFDQSTPFLEYGDFNINEDDDADTMYFQYGRFFGVSLGAGYEAATGNRGLLYTPAFPRFDLKVHYWFDFQLAMNMGIFFASHSFEVGGATTAVKLIGYGIDLKYYFDVRNASAPLTFANPFLIAGIGAINKTITTALASAPDTDSTLSVSFGGGFEFPIVYKKTYLILEGRYHTQNFTDSNSPDYQSKGISDLSGGFFTTMLHVLFTW